MVSPIGCINFLLTRSGDEQAEAGGNRQEPVASENEVHLGGAGGLGGVETMRRRRRRSSSFSLERRRGCAGAGKSATDLIAVFAVWK